MVRSAQRRFFHALTRCGVVALAVGRMLSYAVLMAIVVAVVYHTGKAISWLNNLIEYIINCASYLATLSAVGGITSWVWPICCGFEPILSQYLPFGGTLVRRVTSVLSIVSMGWKGTEAEVVNYTADTSAGFCKWTFAGISAVTAAIIKRW